jgi:hypothetical protein
MISEGPTEAVTIKDKLIVVEQKIIGDFVLIADKQVAYLIVNDNKSSWVKLC